MENNSAYLMRKTCTYNLGKSSIFYDLGMDAYSKGHLLDIYTCRWTLILGWCLLKLYSQVANRQEDDYYFFKIFPTMGEGS